MSEPLYEIVESVTPPDEMPDTVPANVNAIVEKARRFDWRQITGSTVLMLGGGVILLVVAGWLAYSYWKEGSGNDVPEHDHTD